jgi:hypothetical protein
VASGTNYISAVKAVLDAAGINLQNLTPTSKTLPVAKEWAPGATRLQIINDLLTEINYFALWFDENGYAVAEPYVSPQDRSSEYTYEDNDDSVIFPDPEQQKDLFNVPNKWICVVSDSDRTPLVSTYTNDNPDSETSTVSRGRTITRFETVDAVDQTTLDAKVLRLAQEDSQVYEHVPFSTGIMPIHSHLDVLTLVYSDLGISAKYIETNWEMELKVGGVHKHEIRRVVNI